MLPLCIFAALLSFEIHAPHPITEQSASYQYAWAKSKLGPRVAECLLILRDTKDGDGDEHWTLAIALNESGLDAFKISSKGARSSMQTYRKYAPCKKCTLRKAGIMIAQGLLQAQGGHLCEAAARYNAGPKGRCSGVGGAYGRRVQRTYLRLVQWELDQLEGADDTED